MSDEIPDKTVWRFTSAHEDPVLGMFQAIREWMPDHKDKLPLRPYVMGGAGDPVLAFECDDGSEAWEVTIVGLKESLSWESGDPAVYPDLAKSSEGRQEIARQLTLAGRASGQHTITNCARCGKNHEDLEFEVLARPAPSGDLEYTAWAPCPTNGQPVLMETLEGDPPQGERRVFEAGVDPDDLEFRKCAKTAVAEAALVDEPFLVCTLEGEMKGAPGDYLMRGVAGELYPCAADIFEDTYEWVAPQDTAKADDEEYCTCGETSALCMVHETYARE